jgi:hypothetical protein
MKRTYGSGAQKRKKLKITEAELNIQQNSLQHFISIKSREESQNGIRVITTEEYSADISAASSLSPDDVTEDYSVGLKHEVSANSATAAAV